MTHHLDSAKFLSWLKRPFSYLFGGESNLVFQGMAKLALGSGIARMISLASIPVLTRIYSPDDFGTLAVFNAFILLLAPILTLRYPLAIPLPRRDGMALNLAILSASIMLLLTIVISGFFWAFSGIIFELFSTSELTQFWWLIILGAFAAASYEILASWATRQRSYIIIARTNVWQSAAGALTKIGLGIVGLKPNGLLIGQVVTQGGGILILFRSAHSAFRKNRQYISRMRIYKAAHFFRALPIYRVPSQFLMIFSAQSPLLFVAALYDSDTAGQLGLALMALALPIQLFGRTTAKAFYAEASNIGPKNPKKIRLILKSVLQRLALLATMPALILLIFGEILFTKIFGEEWQAAGVFASSLALYLLFQFLQTPVAYVFNLFNGQKKLLFLNIQRTVLVVGIFILAYLYNWSAATAVWTYALALALHYGLSTIYAVRFIPKES